MSTEIVRAAPAALARVDPQALIEKALETGAGIETMERLVALAKDVKAELAREAWYAAMAEFQKRCPPIKKTATGRVQSARASYSYRYAPLDEILSVIQPVMGELGLSVSWRSRTEPHQVIVSCRVSHTAGHHEESGEIAMPIQQGDPDRGANAAQRVGGAATYAKRYSLLGIIGMAPEDDDDAADVPIPARADELTRASGHDPEARITENQVKRFSAIATGQKWSEEQIHDLLTGWRYASRAEIAVKDYDAIVERLKLGPAEGLKRQQTLAG